MKTEVKSCVKFEKITDANSLWRCGGDVKIIYNAEIFITNEDWEKLGYFKYNLGFRSPLVINYDKCNHFKFRKLKEGWKARLKNAVTTKNKYYDLESGTYDIEIVKCDNEWKNHIRVISGNEQNPLPEIRYKCPECETGEMEVFGTRDYEYFVQCGNCGLKYDNFTSRTKAIENFNSCREYAEYLYRKETEMTDIEELENKLKPCPFCGCRGKFYGTYGYGVCCENTGLWDSHETILNHHRNGENYEICRANCHTPLFESPEKAMEIWNTRNSK